MWGEEIIVHAVGDDVNLLRRYVPHQELISIAVAHGHDLGRGSIHPELEPLQNGEQPVSMHGANRLDRLWPEIADLENQRPAPQPLGQDAGPAAEELRTGRNDHIRARQQEGAQRCSEHVRKEAQDPERHSLVGRDERPNSHDADAVDLLRLAQSVSIPVIDAPIGNIGRTGNDRHVPSLSHPAFAQRVNARGGSVPLGNEVVTEEENALGSRGFRIHTVRASRAWCSDLGPTDGTLAETVCKGRPA